MGSLGVVYGKIGYGMVRQGHGKVGHWKEKDRVREGR